MQFFRNGILPQQILGDSATWKSLHIQPWKRGASHWKIQRSLIYRWYQHNPWKLGIRAYWIHSHLFWANLNTIFRETADRRLESPVNVLQHWVRIVTCESCAHTSQGVQRCLAFQVACEFLEAHLPFFEYSERTSIISGQNLGNTMTLIYLNLSTYNISNIIPQSIYVQTTSSNQHCNEKINHFIWYFCKDEIIKNSHIVARYVLR